MSSCLATPTAASYILSAATQLPSSGSYAASKRDLFVKRSGSRLELDGEEFKVVGPNVYWLGLDENVAPSPSYPSKGRILEAMAVASAMGATTIRSQSLGISVGTGLSVENALNTFKSADSGAWDAIDFSVYAARSYNLRLILPLTDQYDYYHGGIPTFLRWRNLSDTDFSPFYDTSSEVYSDFEQYIRELLGHVSPYTNLTLASDPTVAMFETGNELGGWTGNDYPPPVEWTTSIAALLKELAPNTLAMSGSYGVRKSELSIADVDVYSDHFYPLYSSRLSSSASRAHSASKAFLVGEYDWTNRLFSQLRFAWFAMAIPVVLAALVFATPKRWWPWRVSAREVATCGCCCAKRRKRRRRTEHERLKPHADDRHSDNRDLAFAQDPSRPPSFTDSSAPADSKSLFASSSSALPILPPSRLASSPSDTSFPPSRSPPASIGGFHRASRFDRPLLVRPWHVSLAILVVFLPILGALLQIYLPSSISSFLSTSSTLAASSSSPKSAGDLHWSLFGRDDQCCAYVEHSDGYTLHYPAVPGADGKAGGSGEAILRLTRHAWGMKGERPYWLREGREVDDVQLQDLPVVACPQEGLRLANGTVVSG
ncbi:hypothetical protein JCM10207_000880 [Rhodosporidiobolus poonsookiae]